MTFHVVNEWNTNASTELPDLTHPTNVALFRLWPKDQEKVQFPIEYIDLLRFIRINSRDPSSVVVSRPGKHESLKHEAKNEMVVDL